MAPIKPITESPINPLRFYPKNRPLHGELWMLKLLFASDLIWKYSKPEPVLQSVNTKEYNEEKYCIGTYDISKV